MPKLSLEQLQAKANDIRKVIIRITTEAGSGHPSSSLSATGATDNTAIYNSAGFFSFDEIMTIRKLGSPWEGHPNMRRLPGIEASTGSLGQGLSLGVGHALAGRMDQRDYRVYVMMGDGEMGEGQIWEAIATAHKYKLGNLTAIIAQNGYQQTGATKDVLDLTEFQPKLEAFGWHVQTINGNNMAEVVKALDAVQKVADRPTAIVSKTRKGFGILPVLETTGDLNYHGKPLSKELAEKALAHLGG